MDPTLGRQWVLKCWISLDQVSDLLSAVANVLYKSAQMAQGAVKQIRSFSILQMSLLAKINERSVLQSVHLFDASDVEVQSIAIASKSTEHFSSQAFEDA